MSDRYYNRTYVDGSTVRKQQAVPKRQPLPQKSTEQIRKEQERRQAAKRNRQRAMAINRGYVLFLIAATVVCCLICILFIHIQSQITTHMAEVTSLEAQIANLREENTSAENRLETTMTLEDVKNRAGEIGLIYPASNQIQYYSVENNDYMNQYDDVALR